jgi:hypothetical protein
MVSTPRLQSLRSLLVRLKRYTASAPREREQPLHHLLQARTRHQQRQAWQFRMVLLFVGLVIVPLLLPHVATSARSVPQTPGEVTSSPVVAPTPAGPPAGDGQDASIAWFCGTPAAVYAHFGLPQTSVPSAVQLAQLPAPGSEDATSQSLTYDPTQGQLCARSGADVLARFTPPQSAGAGPQASEAPASSCGVTDLGACIVDALTSLWNTFISAFTSFLQNIINSFLNLAFVTFTPPGLTYTNPIVSGLWGWLVGTLDGVLALVLVIGGYNLLFRAERSWYELMPRVILLAVLANFSLFLLSLFIDLANSFIADFYTNLALLGVRQTLYQFLVTLQLPFGFLAVFYAIMLIFLLLISLQMLVRIALLDLLLILAPLGILCFALPQTSAWGRLWAQAFVSALIVQPIQIVLLGLGAALIALPQVGGIAAVFTGTAALYLAFRVPGMLLSNATRAIGSVNGDAGRLANRAADVAALLV